MSTAFVEPARWARDHFSEIIERDEPTIITRHGREVAAVISINDLHYYEELEDRELHRLIVERQDDLDHPGYSLDEVLQETLARDE
jgi:prevent-host-death family protein